MIDFWSTVPELVGTEGDIQGAAIDRDRNDADSSPPSPGFCSSCFWRIAPAPEHFSEEPAGAGISAALEDLGAAFFHDACLSNEAHVICCYDRPCCAK